MATTTAKKKSVQQIIRVATPPLAKRAPARRCAASSRSGSSTMTTELMAAVGLGWAQRAGLLARIPTLGVLGLEGTIAVAGYLWSKNGGPALAGTLGRVAGIVAANHLGRTGLTTSATVAGSDPYDVAGESDY